MTASVLISFDFLLDIWQMALANVPFLYPLEKHFLTILKAKNMFYSIQYISSHQRWSIKKVVLQISQNSQENYCTRVSFLMKFQVSGLQLY